MFAVTIPKKITKGAELVVMPREEYEKMKAQMVPSIFLKGESAKRLDRRVSEGLKEYRKGKTESLETFLSAIG